MSFDKTIIKAFFALVKGGLWEQEVQFSPYRIKDYEPLRQLAEEQGVVGLVAAGLGHVKDMKVPKADVLQFIGQTLQLEQRNKAMNYFIGVTVERMRAAEICSLIVKGQGVAQCYERPLWRSCGDVDFFFDAENYEKAKAFLTPLASFVHPEEKVKKHLAMTIIPWEVELHGLMPTELSERINEGVMAVQRDIFENGGVRVWKNDRVDVLLPSPDNDVIIIMTHFLQHFFIGGVGLRQICDWCRLLWTYQAEIDRDLLEKRLREMGIMSEWKAFAAFAVEHLGMPVDAMPFYEQSARNSRRGGRILDLILETGNFGHNIDESYRTRYPYFVQLAITFWRRLGGFIRRFQIFPGNSPKFFFTYVTRRVAASF